MVLLDHWTITHADAAGCVCLSRQPPAGRLQRKEGADVVVEAPSIPAPGQTSRPGESSKSNAIRKGARITGSAREKLTADLRKKYEKGLSIRALADGTGRSYGFVHRLLVDAAVPLRGRGGATRTKKA
jgi:Helix-turn-helix domain